MEWGLVKVGKGVLRHVLRRVLFELRSLVIQLHVMMAWV